MRKKSGLKHLRGLWQTHIKKILKNCVYLLASLLNTMLENDLLVVRLHAPDASCRVTGTGSQQIFSRIPSADENFGVMAFQYANLEQFNITLGI